MMPDRDPDAADEPAGMADHAQPAPPGPTDHGRHGGMATRENAPELTGGDESKD